MKILLLTLGCFLILLGSGVAATPPDSAYVPVPPEDSKQQSDDSSLVADTTRPTETIPISQAQRLKQVQAAAVKHPRRFSFHDSLLVYFSSERQNQRKSIARSFYHDAGDFFRFDPSYFGMDLLSTPMRQTIQPFGLSGDRMNIFMNDRPLQPFEHIVEPDGMVDFNDVPTAYISDVYLLPGPVGQLFGARNSTASIIMSPKSPDTKIAESRMIVDKGSFAYNFVRGSYAKKFRRRREIDLSIGYRNADGIALNRKDDAYHYFGELYNPLGSKYALKASGQLYDRRGEFVVQPDRTSTVVKRSRTDQSGRLSIEHTDSTGSMVTEFGVESLKQGVDMDRAYFARLNISGRGLFASRQWIVGQTAVALSADFRKREFDDNINVSERKSGGGMARIAILQSGWHYGATLGADYDEEFLILPFGSLTMINESELWFTSLSIGYSERAPSLYEQFLPGRRASVYGEVKDYADRGNPRLQSEKQAVGSVSLEYGTLENNVGVSVTGGRITGGIDWQNSMVSDSAGRYRLFTPVNGDVEFVNVTGQTRINLSDWLHLRGGGSYHYTDYEKFKNKAYQPEYQAFGGTELHFWWPQRLMHLYAYGEAVYSSNYHGYDESNLGEELVVNTKVSFSLKKFRFHFVIENLFNNNHRVRDFATIPGQYSYYGFVWNFLN